MTDRTPPQDIPAEQGVLGGMLLSRHAIAEVEGTLTGAEFYQPAHELVFDAILELYARGQAADAVSVAAHLAKNGDLARVGGAPYLHTLMAAVPVAANAGYYATFVRAAATRRRMAEFGARTVQAAYETDGDDVAAIIDRVQAEAHALSDPRDRAEADPSNLDAFAEMLDRIENGRERGIPTGFADLDQLTGGLHPGQMIIIAARPAIGKSTFGLDICRNVSIRHGIPSVIFELEMDRYELIRRATSAESGVPLHHLAPERMERGDWGALREVTRRIADSPMVIDDSPHLTVQRARTKARRLVQTHGVRLVVIDYLQLMGSGNRRRAESRQVEVSEMSRAIKLMAKELAVPVVVICQLNRGPEQRADKRPMMSDLRESGSLEQDADVVILLHREDAYDKESPRAGEADLIVAKHRNGPTATITVAFQGHRSRFVDMKDG